VSFPPPAQAPSVPPSTADGFVLGPDEGEAFWWLGTLTINKIRSTSTAGGLDVIEHRVAPGYAPPRDVHQGQDEIFYLVDGEFVIECGDQRWDAERGSLVFLPRDVPHGFTVGDRPGRALLFNAPAGFADLVTDLGQPAPRLDLPAPDLPAPDPARVEQASRARGIHPA
jgi:mannose-6-phosphate isomerase-like protein (cupin superfamily)